MSRSRVVAATVAGLMLLLTGCGAGGGGMPADGGMPEAPAPMPQEPDSPAGPGERQIARTAAINLVVTDVRQVATQLRQVAETVGGMVTSESISLPAQDEEWSDYSQVVVTVPSDRLDEALNLIGGLGEVRHRSIEAVDVSDSVLDIDARVKTMRESIARLQELMERAGSVAEIAAVEAELSQRQAELESLLAQQKNLRDRVAMAPISVGLYPPDRAVQAGAVGFVGGLVIGWESLVSAGRVALTAVGVLLPWLALVALVATPLVWWRRRRRASRPKAPDQPSATPPAAQPPAQVVRPVPPGSAPVGPTPPSGGPGAPASPSGSATPGHGDLPEPGDRIGG